MLLRRIKTHVAKENWFAVFIDFLIVVVGVFIGIQVANWNELENDAVREQEILISILDDLKVDLEVLNNASDMAKANIDTSNYILERAGFNRLENIVLPVVNFQVSESNTLTISAADPIPDARKDHLWKFVTLRYFPIQSDSAFSSLIAAGDLKLISDASLVSELQNYHLLWTSIECSNDTTFKPFRNRTVFVGQEFGLSPFSTFHEIDLITLVKNNSKLKSVVSSMLEYTVLQKHQIQNIKQSTESLIVKVEMAIE